MPPPRPEPPPTLLPNLSPRSSAHHVPVARSSSGRLPRSRKSAVIFSAAAAAALFILTVIVHRLRLADTTTGSGATISTGGLFSSLSFHRNRGRDGSSDRQRADHLPAILGGGGISANPRLSDPIRCLNDTLVPARPPLGPVISCNKKSSNSSNKHPNSLTDGQSGRLVFVHVLKTAGTTLRRFFAEYASICSVGWLEVQCSAPDVHTIGRESSGGGGVWQSRTRRNPCVQKSFVLRTGESHHKTDDIHNDFVSKEIDVMGGHMPLGTGAVWDGGGTSGGGGGDGEQYHDVTYLSFFRNAAIKYVSGEAFWKPDVTKSELVRQTKDKVRKAVERDEYHNKYGIYLLTPDQREGGYSGGNNTDASGHTTNKHSNRPSRPSLPVDEAAVEVMLNVLELGVVAGITERMSESMEMIRRLVDGDVDGDGDGGDGGETDADALAGIFEKFGLQQHKAEDEEEGEGEKRGSDKGGEQLKRNENAASSSSSSHTGSGAGAAGGGIKINPSKVSSSDVMAELSKDVAFMQELLECVKYEQQITDFALAVHLRQYASLRNG